MTVNALVLQGGGALGGYQVGVYKSLEKRGYLPDLVVGISIGAINSAIIAGNLPQNRVAKLNEFWLKVSHNTGYSHGADHYASKNHNQFSSQLALLFGQTGFFRPRIINPWLMQNLSPENSAYYDTTPLKDTLLEVIDFKYLNSAKSPRFSVGAVELESGKFVFFDNREIEILPEHIMASGALPPGFPPIKIDGLYYVDGGVFLNTPMVRVFDLFHTAFDSCGEHVLCFMVDLFSHAGYLPKDMDGMLERVKDIQFSSRTERMMCLFSDIHQMRYGVKQIYPFLTEEQKQNPLFQSLLAKSCATCLDIVHLVYHSQQDTELHSKDYEFSMASYTLRSKMGYSDTEKMINKNEAIWQKPREGAGIALHTMD